ncbi:MAG: hypothetical protein WBG46_08845 [Nonlabens sp.]
MFTITVTGQDLKVDLLQGSWQLEQVISSKLKKTITLNIKYSNRHKRYFGNVKSRSITTTLDSINFNPETSLLIFSSHMRNNNLFVLTLTDNKLSGTVSSQGNTYKISGLKKDSPPVNIKEYSNYQKTKLPSKDIDLFESKGKTSSSIVLLIVQGGPFDEIQYSPQQFESWTDKLHIALVKQTQILNPTILPPENNLSLMDARYETKITVDILHRVIQHFKQQNKKILVWGVSYGAWVIQKYITEYGIDVDAMSIAAGRLDLEKEIWKEGKLNQKVYDITYKRGKRIYTEMGFTYTKPLSYLLAAVDEERYTQSLSSKDLSNLVVYQYGKKDGTVGRLNSSEMKFLKSKNVDIEICNKCYHRQMLSKKIMNSAITKMLEFIDQN